MEFSRRHRRPGDSSRSASITAPVGVYRRRARSLIPLSSQVNTPIPRALFSARRSLVDMSIYTRRCPGCRMMLRAGQAHHCTCVLSCSHARSFLLAACFIIFASASLSLSISVYLCFESFLQAFQAWTYWPSSDSRMYVFLFVLACLRFPPYLNIFLASSRSTTAYSPDSKTSLTLSMTRLLL